MVGELQEARGQSALNAVVIIAVSTISSIIFAIAFVITYITLSEYHREAVEVHRSLLSISDMHLNRHFSANIIWVLDATIAFICLFLIVEDAFRLYELNCELRALNCAAHLSLREALEIDNRYLKDAIILEAKEAQEDAAGGMGKSHKAQNQGFDYDEDDDDTAKISKMMGRPIPTRA
ncbi:hypothetical protein V3C99_001586 [Haemonchus contortus]